MITFRQPFRGEYPITQQYGEVIPGITYQGKPHTGIDYGCPAGTEILASADGIVMKSGWDVTGYGNVIIILHDAKHATLYAHLSKCSVYLNQKVKQGEVIGLSGATGGTAEYPTTGPHLHFEARRKWNDYTTHFNPYDLPLMSVDDNIKPAAGNQNPAEPVRITSGIYRVACDVVNVRSWETLQVEKQSYRGDPVYVFDRAKNAGELTFYYIGAGSAMAAVDIEGTILLERVE